MVDDLFAEEPALGAVFEALVFWPLVLVGQIWLERVLVGRLADPI